MLNLKPPRHTPTLRRFLDAGNTETLRMVGEPASKKRQGTKSLRSSPLRGAQAEGLVTIREASEVEMTV